MFDKLQINNTAIYIYNLNIVDGCRNSRGQGHRFKGQRNCTMFLWSVTKVKQFLIESFLEFKNLAWMDWKT